MLLSPEYSSSSNASNEDSHEKAWTLVLRHTSVASDAASVARLFCVSHGMREMLHTYLTGQVCLQFRAPTGGAGDTSKCVQLGEWLGAHATLLRELQYTQATSPSLDSSMPEQQQQVWHLATGLNRAATAAQHSAARLAITSFSCSVCAWAVVSQLSRTMPHLTRLELGPHCTDELQKHLKITSAISSSKAVRSRRLAMALGIPPLPDVTCSPDHPSTPPASPSAHSSSSQAISHPAALMAATTATRSSLSSSPAGAAAAAGVASSPPGSPVSNISYPPYCSSVLAALPALCSLVLHGPAASTLLGAVPACMGLKQLTLSNLPCTKVHMLQDLPPQLQELCVSVDPDFTSWQRKRPQPMLRHLSALTALTCTGEGLFAVQAHERLPPRLVRLVVSDCPKAEPLLVLQDLAVLALQAATMDAQQLAQLPAALPCLRDIQLRYDRSNMEAIAAASGGWPALAGVLKGLDLSVYPGPLPAKTLGHLAELGPALTRLNISGFNVQLEATPSVFAATLAALRGLHELKLAYLRFMEELAVQPALPDTPAHAGAAAVAGSSAGGGSGFAEGDAATAGAEAAAAAAGGGDGDLRSVGTQPAAPAAEQPAVASGAGVFGRSGLVLLMRTIGALPALDNLSLHSMVLSGPPLAALLNPGCAGRAPVSSSNAASSSRTTATASALTPLSLGSRLTALQLNECDLCDADVANLAVTLTGLRRLGLNLNFSVSAEGLGCLSRLRGLQELHVCCGTSRYEPALSQLQQLLPGLNTAS